MTSKDNNSFNLLIDEDDEDIINKDIIYEEEYDDDDNDKKDIINKDKDKDDDDNEEYNEDILNDENDIIYEEHMNNDKKYDYNNPFKKQVWKKKENIYCNNCGKYGHLYKKCYDPITSYGIICINLNNPKIYNFFISKYKFPNNSYILKNICINKYIQKNITCNNRKDLDIFEKKISENTEYLIVRRKYTYNYIHIIRGLYDIDLENIIKSINLLTEIEYNNILTLDFDILWENIWENSILKNNSYDYKKAKDRFELLKTYIIPQINHKIKIIYNYPEWGLPKGKRNNNESNIECAQREFEEETGITSNDYELLDRLYPLIENIKGSNGINYKHVYYISILKPSFNTLDIKIEENNNFSEIGDIGLYNIDKIKDIIRKYNTERIDILNNINIFLTYNTRYFEKFYYENKLLN